MPTPIQIMAVALSLLPPPFFIDDKDVPVLWDEPNIPVVRTAEVCVVSVPFTIKSLFPPLQYANALGPSP
jgi:hypothetical protein